MKYMLVSALMIGALVSCGGNKEVSEETPTQEITNVEVKSVGELTIGYYNLEEIPNGFNFYKETQATLEKEGAAIEAELMRWQNEGIKAQNSLQAGMQNQTLTDNQALALQQKMQDCERNMARIQQQKLEPFQAKSFEMNEKLTNKINAYGREFSQKNGLKMFVSYAIGGSVTYIDSTFNMTDEFIDFMNTKEDELNQIAQ